LTGANALDSLMSDEMWIVVVEWTGAEAERRRCAWGERQTALSDSCVEG